MKRLKLITPVLMVTCLLAIFSFSAFAQTTGEIRGVVTSKTGETLIGTNILIVGTTRGVITNFEGAYSIKGLAPGQYKLVARFIGYIQSQKTINVVAGETAEVNFTLEQDYLKLDEVVITGLSGEIPRSELGSAISKVSGEALVAVPVTSVSDGLAGKVTGMNVTKSTGTPGTGTYITIRGRTTITGSSQPLYVIDGVPIDDSFIYDGSGTNQGANRSSDVDPNDVESVEILKGASAAAIYGSRAANGVILITTKSGKVAEPGKMAKVSYTSSYSFDNVTTRFPLQTKYGQRIPYVDGKPGSGSTDSWGARLHDTVKTFDHDKYLFRTGHLAENTLSVSGGNPFFKYLVSGTLTDHAGVVIKSDYSRQNVRLNMNYTPFSNFNLKSNSSYISSVTNLPQDGSNTSGILLGALRSPPEFDNRIYLEADGVTQRRYATYDNPFWTMEFNTYKTELTRFIHSTGFDYDFIEGFRLSGNLGWDRYNHFNFERKFNDAAGTAGRLGDVEQNRYTNNVINTDLMLTGKHQFTPDILGTIILGQQLSFFSRNSTYGYSSNTLPFYHEIGAGVSRDAGSSRSENRIYSHYIQAMVNGWDKLTLSGAVRRDAGSTFGAANRVYYYPKASVAYRLSQESFMKDLKGIIDEVKLRAAWGQAGRTPGAYATNNLYFTSGWFDPWGRRTSAGRLGNSGIRNSTSRGNDEIEPELNTEIETGFDMAFLNRRVNIEFSYYKQDITQLLLFVPLPYSTGFESQLRNGGEMWNKGYEIKFDVNPYRSEAFSWIAGINYSANKNEVTKLQGFETSYITITGGFVGVHNVAKIGKPLGTWMGGGFQRDAAGNIVYSDTTTALGRKENFFGFPTKNAPRQAAVLVEMGNADPKWSGSLRNDFSFFGGDLTVSVLLDAVWGFDIWNGTKGALYNFGTHKDTEDRADYWFNELGQPVLYQGTTPSTLGLAGGRTYQPGDTLRREVWYRVHGNGFTTREHTVEDGSFVKLRDVSVSYRLKKVPFFNIESIIFTFSGRNLHTWTDYDGYDPEINTFQQAEGRGFDYYTLPQVRSFRFGITINY